MELLDISISNKWEDRRKTGRSTNHRVTASQWPRLYSKPVEDSIKDKNWELRNYVPKVMSI